MIIKSAGYSIIFVINVQHPRKFCGLKTHSTYRVTCTVIVNGTPLFVAADVAKALGYTNTSEAVGDHCKKAVPVGNHSKTLGLSSLTKLIPESDVYRLVMRSKLPATEKFQDWVIEVVLPSLRRDADGRYCLNDLHKAAGSAQKDAPRYWLETKQAKDLTGILSDSGIPLSVVKGGVEQGTFVCKEMVYAYAMWISAAFQLKVIKAYDALVTGLMKLVVEYPAHLPAH